MADRKAEILEIMRGDAARSGYYLLDVQDPLVLKYPGEMEGLAHHHVDQGLPTDPGQARMILYHRRDGYLPSQCLQYRQEDSEEYREQLFNKWIRIADGNSREPKRLGLGLYFTRKILQKQEGDIRYQPKGNGSNFVVTLPGIRVEDRKEAWRGMNPHWEGSAIPASFRSPTMTRT